MVYFPSGFVFVGKSNVLFIGSIALFEDPEET